MEEINERMDDVGETNRLLSLELEDRNKKLKAAEEERDEAVLELNSLKEKIKTDQTLIGVQRDKLDALEKEVHYLSSRQIDPNLEQTIKQTQGMIRDSLHHFPTDERSNFDDYSGVGSGVGGGRVTQSEDAMKMKVVDRMRALCAAAESLVTKTADAVVYFEQSVMGGMQGGAEDVVYKELQRLLASNSKLSMQIKQIALEWQSDIMTKDSTSRNEAFAGGSSTASSMFYRDDATGSSGRKSVFNPSPPNPKPSPSFLDDSRHLSFEQRTQQSSSQSSLSSSSSASSSLSASSLSASSLSASSASSRIP